ncbi:MAG: pantoate--beta-alanine ligase [Alphaproteobacteria bacterium]|nr:MAG: pantoate--beta-alanine ligase [Alphaproteobacteria bacterium]
MIKIFTTIKDYAHYRNTLVHNSVGIIPTMGNLHEGHLSLLKKSMEDNQVSVITIFVNPKQFGPSEDFEKYPRTLDADLAKISNLALHAKNIDKEIVVFAPINNEQIYPKGFNTVIRVLDVTEKLEGAKRPNHFDGVTTVVYRLFKIINATNAYFGQKDFQQCVVIKKMILDLDLDINFHIMPIIRNSEGLALSSRNQYLSESERSEALHLSETLKQIEMFIKNKKDYSSLIEAELTNNKWDYLEVLNANNLETPNEATREMVIIGVYKLGNTRLLDNILVQTL